MADVSENRSNQEDSSVADVVREYMKTLPRECTMLIALKAQLYGRSWVPMLDDLENRLEGKPYIFKLVNRIKDDIDRIEVMKVFEEKHGVDLADFVQL